MPVKWATVLPVTFFVLNLVLLRLMGSDPEASDRRFLDFFVGINAPIVFLRFLPSICQSPAGSCFGLVNWGLNVAVGAPLLWYAIGRYLDASPAKQGGVVPVIIGFALAATSVVLAAIGIGGSEYWNRLGGVQEGPTFWMPYWVCGLFLAWAAALLLMATRIVGGRVQRR